ncbi:MAG: glycosyltransferase [Nitrospira sp. CR1.3]|nr:glycosyltransferase [Nitrospira sp. CR1.3]
MRIGIDASPIIGDRGGVGWHTYYLLQAMLELPHKVEIIGYLRPGSALPEDVRSWKADGRMSWIEAPKWAMRWRGRTDRLDLYHGTNFKMHTTGRQGGIVTIHDLWLERFPEYSTKMLGQKLSSIKTRRTARRARKVITVSNFSARELVDLYALSPERIAVISNGVADNFLARQDDSAMDLLRKRIGLPAKPFILFVGGADPRKNHRRFLEGAALVRRQLAGRVLLLVGSTIHPFGSYQDTAKSCGVSDLVICPGRLSKADLQLLYTYADLFVFPSLYEGFGMPVLEAMACGAPVITSQTTALVEVAGDAAVLVDPSDARALGEAMVRVMENESLRTSLKAKGLARAKLFTWREAASQTLELYRELCEAG